MGKIDLNKYGYVDMIDKALKEYLPSPTLYDSKTPKAMEYSLLNPGKRLRPVLALSFCKVAGGDIEQCLPFACAMEMIHCYSLIHDDLPCMDDDDLRRGKPANHIVFGEDNAVLAGDALLNLAFETMLNSEVSKNSKTQDRAVKCMREVAFSSGIYGMIGGQAIDLEFENKAMPLSCVLDMYEKKTGAIIISSCKIGAIIAGADDKMVTAAQEYARTLGLAFQIVDDILDLTSDEETLGKPINSDLKSGKNTYLSIVGMNEAKDTVQELTDKAIASLSAFNADTSFLRDLALHLCERKN